jgi:hypothetical protein
LFLQTLQVQRKLIPDILNSPQCTIKSKDGLCIDVVSKTLDLNCPEGAYKCDDAGFEKAWCGECGTLLVEAQPDKSIEYWRAKICQMEAKSAPKQKIVTNKNRGWKKNADVKMAVKSFAIVGLLFVLLI